MGWFDKKPPPNDVAKARGKAARAKRNKRLQLELDKADRRQTADERRYGAKPRRPRMR